MPIFNPNGQVGRQEFDLFWVSTGIMLLIIVPVIVAVLALAWKYRAEANAPDYDPDFDHSKVLSRVMLFVPLFTVAILGVVTWIYTHRLDPYKPLPGKERPLEIQAIGLDYKWLFIYPEFGIATVNELAAPIGRPVTIRQTSDPMMTAIFIPGLVSQIYAMAGMETRTNFRADHVGKMAGKNAMLNGEGFAYQRFDAYLQTPEDFNQWVTKVRAAPLTLDMAAYAKVAKRSEEAYPVTYFAKVDGDIFSNVVRKFNPAYRLHPLPAAQDVMADSHMRGHH